MIICDTVTDTAIIRDTATDTVIIRDNVTDTVIIRDDLTDTAIIRDTRLRLLRSFVSNVSDTADNSNDVASLVNEVLL
jgi:hypothetical protein